MYMSPQPCICMSGLHKAYTKYDLKNTYKGFPCAKRATFIRIDSVCVCQRVFPYCAKRDSSNRMGHMCLGVCVCCCAFVVRKGPHQTELSLCVCACVRVCVRGWIVRKGSHPIEFVPCVCMCLRESPYCVARATQTHTHTWALNVAHNKGWQEPPSCHPVLPPLIVALATPYWEPLLCG